mgnify:CR=1 FL=1
MDSPGTFQERSDSITIDNMRRINDPDGAAYIKGICGDSMEMYLVIDKGTVTNATFFTDRCNHSRFCGSTAARRGHHTA